MLGPWVLAVRGPGMARSRGCHLVGQTCLAGEQYRVLQSDKAKRQSKAAERPAGPAEPALTAGVRVPRRVMHVPAFCRLGAASILPTGCSGRKHTHHSITRFLGFWV